MSSEAKYRIGLPALIIAAFVVTGNLLFLTGIFQANPVLYRSALSPSVRQGSLSGQFTIDPNDGFTAQALGRRAAEDWLHGDLPYWNRYEGLGTPLAGEMQSAAMFPLVPLLALPNGLLYMHVLLEIVAGITTFLFLLELGRSRHAAVLGGCLFALCGTFGWLTNAVFNPIAFLPLILFALERMRSKVQADQRLGWGLLGAGIALSAYAGFPEVAFIDLLFVGGWAVVRCFQLPGRQRLIFARRLIAGGIFGLALAAPILVAFVDYLAQAYNAHADISGRALPAISAFALFMPYVYGPIFGFYSFDRKGVLGVFWGNVGGYLSAGTVALAAIALLGRRQRPIKLYLAAWSVLVCLKIFGVRPVGRVFDVIPGVGPTAFYRYSLVSVEFAVVVLAMTGIDDLRERRVRRAGLAWAAFAVLGLCGLFLLGARQEVHALAGAPGHHTWAVLSAAVALGLVVLVFGAALVRPGARPWIVGAAVAFEALGLYVVPQFSTPSAAPLDQAPIQFVRHNIGQARVYSLGPMAANYGSYFGIPEIDVNDALIPKSWAHYITTQLDPNTDPLNFIATVRKDPAGPSAEAMLMAHLESYEAVGVKFILAPAGAMSGDAAAQGVRSVFRDRSFEIWQLPQPASYYQASDASCQVSGLGPDRARVVCSRPASLIRIAQYMPGWHATVNGHRVTVFPEHSLLQRVAVPAGIGDVTFSFEPPHVREAWAALVVALCVWALMAGVPGFRARQRLAR